tara:strand:+ start:284 stop:448 length:165 start_codon:yes stop_codon:yes gene_type:complete
LGVAILLAAQQQQCLLKENENGLSNDKPSIVFLNSSYLMAVYETDPTRVALENM